MQKIVHLFHQYFSILAALFFAMLFYIFRGDYFFGDAITSTSRSTTYIFEQGIYFYPSGFDPGHPPTYSILLAFCWKLFGKSLLVSHAYGMLWCVILFVGFRKVSRLFLSLHYTNYASVLVLMHPTFISQNAMMLNTSMLMGCFLWSIYYLVSKQNLKLTIILSIMIVTHLQGSFFLASIAITDFIINRKTTPFLSFLKTKFLVYAIPFILFLGWLLVHYYHAGWWIISPDFSDAHETNSLLQVVKGLAYCTWRFIDYGMLVPILIYFIAKIRSKKIDDPDLLLWIPLLVSSIIMSLILKNTIAHRYFLGFELFLIILTIREISFYSKQQAIYYIMMMVAFAAGNFIYYPGKTIADANIRYRDSFGAMGAMYQDLSPNKNIFSKAPLANPMKYINLQSDDTYLKRIDWPMESLPAVVSSNVCAEFTTTENEILNTWYGKSYEHGAVYVNYFLNPKYNEKPTNWKLREPGILETWMSKLKKKFK